jgi:hypothetical protein
LETAASEEMIVAGGCFRCNLFAGRGFLYERENYHGDEEGSQEVHEEDSYEEEQCEEVEFIAQVQSIGG